MRSGRRFDFRGRFCLWSRVASLPDLSGGVRWFALGNEAWFQFLSCGARYWSGHRYRRTSYLGNIWVRNGLGLRVARWRRRCRSGRWIGVGCPRARIGSRLRWRWRRICRVLVLFWAGCRRGSRFRSGGFRQIAFSLRLRRTCWSRFRHMKGLVGYAVVSRQNKQSWWHCQSKNMSCESTSPHLPIAHGRRVDHRTSRPLAGRGNERHRQRDRVDFSTPREWKLRVALGLCAKPPRTVAGTARFRLASPYAITRKGSGPDSVQRSGRRASDCDPIG